MLCSSKINNRPDRTLQRALFKLSFSLILLTFSLIWFFLNPATQFYSTLTTSLITIYCLITALKTLTAGEAAISYGGFANEIIKNDFKIRRIENPAKESILQNDPAKKLLKESDVFSFLEKYLADGAQNKAALYRLQTAAKNLSSEKVTLSLILKQSTSRIFNDLEYFEVSIRPIYLKKPKIFDGAFSVKRIKKETYLYWTLHNITAKQNMDYVFKEECSYLHDFLDNLPVGLYTIDKDYRINYINRNMSEFLGHSAHSLIGLSLQDFLIQESNIPLKKDFWSGPVHFASRTGEAEETYVFQSSYREKEKIMLRGVVIHNLPTPEDLKQEVSRSLDKVNWLFKHSPVGILFTDNDGKIIEKNPKASNLLSLPEDKDNQESLFSNLNDENAQALRKAFSKAAAQKDYATAELKNEQISLTLYISALHLLHQQTQNFKTSFVIYVIDTTKQKNLELQFSQAQKMQAIGLLAGGVAHDFNNLLTAMLGFTDLLLQRHGLGDPSFADLIQIKNNANRATNLVRQLLAFSRKQPLLPKLIDVTENFADLSPMLKRVLGERIKLTFKHGTDLGFIKVDPNQFSQVIINLVANAKDAMNGTGSLTISTGTFRLDETYMFGDDTIDPGDFVVINVEDTGCGIPKENLNRIFDPFFTTKENTGTSGTGLGLAMVYGIVRQTEGFIKVNSTLGKGTTFSIFLPRFETGPEEEMPDSPKRIVSSLTGKPILQVQETISAPADVNQKIIMGLNIFNTIDRNYTAVSRGDRPAKILFVEDEDAVRTFAVRALKKKGYTVIDSDSAESALKIIDQENDFDLLITDMVLPGISGAQLTNQIKEKHPNIDVILASGYSEDIARQEVDNTHEFDFIAKPYSLSNLTAKVFEVLNRKHD